MTNNQHIVDLIPEYVLDLLEPQQADQVAAHLQQCAACRAELEAYQRVIDQLALGAPQKSPPAALRAKILAGTGAVPPAPEIPRQAPGWRARLAGLFSAPVPGWAVVSLVFIGILAVVNLLLWWQLANVRQELAQQNPLQVVAMANTEAAPGAGGLLIISGDGRHGTLVVDQLPVLDEQHAYQIWLIRDNVRTSGGVFTVDEDGYGSKYISAPDPLISYPAFGVTIEPAEGSPGPTGEKVLGGEL